MKKLITAGAIILTSLTLASCSTNNDVATTKAGNITKEDLYEAMKTTAG